MNKFKKTSFVMVLLLLFALLVIVGLSTSFATDRNITNTTDGGISGAVNSSLANDKIIMSDGIYSGNNNKDVIINKNLTITGSNKANTVIDLSGGSKLFTINSGASLILSNLTIKNAMIGNNSYLINNDGYLTMENCVITDNSLSFNIRENTTYTSNDVLEDDSFESGYLVGNNGQMNIINSAFINNNMNINYQYYQNVPYTASTTLYFNNTIYNSSVVGSGFIVNKGRLNITRSEFTNNTIKTTINRQYNWNNDQNIIINLRNPNNETVIGDQSTNYIYSMIVNSGDLIITQSNFQNNTNNYNETRNYNKNTTLAISGGSGKKTTDVSIYNLIYSINDLKASNSTFTNNGYNTTYESNNTNYKSASDNVGGAIYIVTLANSTVSCSIVSSTFVNNTANNNGGGVYVNTNVNGIVSCSIVNSSFVNNTANNSGGGVYVSTNVNGIVSCSIVNSTFVNNTATVYGGGVFVAANGNNSVSIVNSSFVNNTANQGGGVLVTSFNNANTSVDIVSSSFVNNTANDAGGIYLLGGGANGIVSLDIVNSSFVNNNATTGGGLRVHSYANSIVSLDIVNSTFVNNTATVYGGGVYVIPNANYIISVDIVNSSFVNNTAIHGGGVYVTANGIASVDIVSSSFVNNNATVGGGVYVTSGTNGNTSVSIVNSSFVNNTAIDAGGVLVASGTNGIVSVDITNSTFVNNTATSAGGGVVVISGVNGTVSADILSSTFVNSTNDKAIYISNGVNGTVSADILSSTFVNSTNDKAIYISNGVNGTVSVVVNYNVFLNHSTGTISKASASSAVVDADYNYWGFNSIPTLTNVVVNNYYVLGITNMSDLGANYTVGDLLSFNYTVYLNGTSDSTNASNLPSLNSIFYNDLLYGYFSLNAPGIIQVPVQTVVGGVFNFTNANGTVIGNFMLTGTIFPGSVSNITVPEIIIVNNTSVDLVISIPTSVGGLAGQTFNVTINGQSQTVTFVNGTGTFVGYQYGNLGLNSLNITLSDNPNYNNSSAINNVFFKEETNINANVNDTIYGENATIVINTITNGQSIADGTYTVILNGVEYNVTFTNGIGQVILSGLNAGEYNYTIIFNSTDKYTESETNITINVIKADINIGVNLPSNATYGGNSTISGNLTTNGSLLDGTYNITVTVNGVDYNVTVTDGLWSLTIPNTNVGTANVNITFQNSNYNNATIATSYTVNPKNLGTKITITSTRNGNKITYKITLKDSQGNVLANQNLSLTIAGKTVTVRTNGQGIAQYTFTATKAGNYQANAAFNGLNTGNIIYASSSGKSNTIKITKTNIKVYKTIPSAKKIKSKGKIYKVYSKIYYIKNYGELTGSKTYTKYFKKGLILSKISKTKNIKTSYNKTKKILKIKVLNLAFGKIAKIKLKAYKRIA
ncbi:beta strand repeat-containing protein [Methanobrevibacter cuticularis]|nr:Ig-like domain-containing protein [Methanobrevibacter cuticularis]